MRAPSPHIWADSSPAVKLGQPEGRGEFHATFEEEAEMGDLLPGGYTMIHMIFWPVVALVAVGTNAVPIILSISLLLLVLESLGKG